LAFRWGSAPFGALGELTGPTCKGREGRREGKEGKGREGERK